MWPLNRAYKILEQLGSRGCLGIIQRCSIRTKEMLRVTCSVMETRRIGHSCSMRICNWCWKVNGQKMYVVVSKGKKKIGKLALTLEAFKKQKGAYKKLTAKSYGNRKWQTLWRKSQIKKREKHVLTRNSRTWTKYWKRLKQVLKKRLNQNGNCPS